MTSTITARRLLRGNEILDYPRVTIDDGHITSILSGESGHSVYSYPEAMLVPSYLNIHVHGSAGFDVMEGTPKALHAIGASLAGHGVGAYYPTTVTSSTEEALRALEKTFGRVQALLYSSGQVAVLRDGINAAQQQIFYCRHEVAVL